MKKIVTCIIILLTQTFSSECQTPTIGLLQNDSGAFNGYTLFSPNTYNRTYLIDNCGMVVNSWQGSSQPGLATYFLEDGTLLKTARVNNPVFSSTGGSGGRIERYDWSNNLIWSYNYSDSTRHQHHDIEYLPNGNILVLAWEVKSSAYAIDNGRSPSLVNSTLWLEHIVEVEPVGSDSATIVWEWHVSDHLIQDYDSSKFNYGLVEDHPELINFNFANTANQDWLHINSIDYNPALDQIILSIHNSGEVWIIDHSTTTLEAASHTGGNSGKGGDLLYRWGNPRAYRRGGSIDQKLWGQHDAHWIEPGFIDAGKIMIFNNGAGRPGGNYSSVNIIQTPIDSLNNYTIVGLSPYGPDTSFWEYTSTPPSTFYSANISGAQRLPNGNTLICEGSSGNFFEIDTNKVTVWNYINPVNQTGPLNQGTNPTGNAVFKCIRYAENYSGFTGLTLSSGNPVELNPYTNTCMLYTSSRELNLKKDLVSFEIYPNPATDKLTLKLFEEIDFTVEISDMTGRLYKEIHSGTSNLQIQLDDLPAGMYLVCVQHLKAKFTKRLVKL